MKKRTRDPLTSGAHPPSNHSCDTRTSGRTLPTKPRHQDHKPALKNPRQEESGTTETRSEPSGGTLALRTGLGLLALFGVMFIGALYLKGPMEQAGRWFFDAFGLPGMFVGTALSDFIGIPIPVDVYLAAAVTANTPTLPVIAVASAASLLGGNLAFVLGARFDRIPIIKNWIGRFKARGEAAFEKWGVAAVAVAAWTPIPFSIICLAAGTFKMPWRSFFLTSLNRIPRIILYYYVISLGWSIGDLS